MAVHGHEHLVAQVHRALVANVGDGIHRDGHEGDAVALAGVLFLIAAHPHVEVEVRGGPFKVVQPRGEDERAHFEAVILQQMRQILAAPEVRPEHAGHFDVHFVIVEGVQKADDAAGAAADKHPLALQARLVFEKFRLITRAHGGDAGGNVPSQRRGDVLQPFAGAAETIGRAIAGQTQAVLVQRVEHVKANGAPPF